jgi:hypothetical protein
MEFASSANGQLRYIPEVTPGTTPVAGDAIDLRMTSPTMKAAIATVKSNEVRSDRLATGSSRTDLNLDGGFNFELSGKEYDPFLEGLLHSSFVHYGTAGLGAAFEATTLAGSITAAVAPTGDDAFTNLGLGEWFKVVPPSGASAAVKAYFADRWFKTHGSTAATSTVITLDASTPIEAPGIVTSQAGYKISQSIISNGTTKKYFTLEYEMTDIGEFFWFKGMRTNSMNLSLDVGAIITGSFDFIGMSHDNGAASVLPGTPQASQTLEVMNAVADVGLIYENGASLLTSGSFIKGAKINVSNSLRGQKALATFGNAGVGAGELVLGGSLELYVPDATYYQKWLQGTNTSLALGMADSAGNGYLIEFGKVTFKDGALNMGGRNDDTMLSLPFDAFYDPVMGKGIRITRAVAA